MNRFAWTVAFLAMALPWAPLICLTAAASNVRAPVEEHETFGQHGTAGTPLNAERRSPAVKRLLRVRALECDSRRVALLAHQPPAIEGHFLANGLRAPLCC